MKVALRKCLGPNLIRDLTDISDSGAADDYQQDDPRQRQPSPSRVRLPSPRQQRTVGLQPPPIRKSAISFGTYRRRNEDDNDNDHVYHISSRRSPPPQLSPVVDEYQYEYEEPKEQPRKKVGPTTTKKMPQAKATNMP